MGRHSGVSWQKALLPMKGPTSTCIILSNLGSAFPPWSQELSLAKQIKILRHEFLPELEGTLFPWRVLGSDSLSSSWLDLNWHSSEQPRLLQTSAGSLRTWTCTWESHTWLQPGNFKRVHWKHVFKIKTDKVARPAVEPRKTPFFLKNGKSAGGGNPSALATTTSSHKRTPMHWGARPHKRSGAGL